MSVRVCFLTALRRTCIFISWNLVWPACFVAVSFILSLPETLNGSVGTNLHLRFCRDHYPLRLVMSSKSVCGFLHFLRFTFCKAFDENLFVLSIFELLDLNNGDSSVLGGASDWTSASPLTRTQPATQQFNNEQINVTFSTTQSFVFKYSTLSVLFLLPWHHSKTSHFLLPSFLHPPLASLRVSVWESGRLERFKSGFKHQRLWPSFNAATDDLSLRL